MKFFKYIIFLSIIGLFTCCEDVLDKKPLDKVTGEDLFSDPEGVTLYMANLYYQLPIEDFTFSPFRGPNFNYGEVADGGFVSAMITDEAVHSERSVFYADNIYDWWEAGYKLIHDVNVLIDYIPNLDVSEAERKSITGECSFIRAYAYFALAKRYGGLSIITKVQEYDSDTKKLRVPRSTEKDTWDFVLSECDHAVENLPDSWNGQRRATLWVAYALKSRAALFAASVAKYWNKAPLSGDAVSQNLVGGMTSTDADKYYNEVITASEAVIKSGKFSLYKPSPANTEEAAKNYQALFYNPNNALEEAMFIKGYTQPGRGTSHDYDFWYNPSQTAAGGSYPGRMNPTLDLIDTYETYANPGNPAPVQTRTDGNITDYSGFRSNVEYLHFEKPSDIFEGKDARLHATIVIPGSNWKNQEIIIQAGFIRPDGTAVIRQDNSYVLDGKTYYAFGAQDQARYSGFNDTYDDKTRSGFSFKKFLHEDFYPSGALQSTSDFADIRYAEVLLNYAEAVLESGYQNKTLAEEGFNAIRRRAGYSTNISFILNNVLRERRIELAFENKRNWDLIRRREYHTLFNSYSTKSLYPLLDMRVSPPKYVFIRYNIPGNPERTFLNKWYYQVIPGISGNGLVQNPEY